MSALLILSFVEWSGAFQRPQHMAIEFARRGWDVTYISPGYLHRKKHNVECGINLPRNLKIVRPTALPGARKSSLIGSINEWSLRRAIEKNEGAPWDVVIFNDPRFARPASRANAGVRIYDAMDDLSNQVRTRKTADQNEQAALNIADRVWTGTPSLADRYKSRHSHVRFIPCGVDARRFANPKDSEVGKARAELQGLFPSARPLAGYFGAINERFDISLVEVIAAENWNVLLIGPGGLHMPDVPSRPNLKWIGPRPYASLAAYLAIMDLALIPYRTDGPNRYLYPVKALEYLVGAKPVLSSPLPDLERILGDFISFRATPAEWAAFVRDWQSVQHDAHARALRGHAYAKRRTWEKMIEEMSDELAAAGRGVLP